MIFIYILIHQVTVEARDGGDPFRAAYETFLITVNRNLASPIFTVPSNLQSYSATTQVLETIGFADLVYAVTAVDSDTVR